MTTLKRPPAIVVKAPDENLRPAYDVREIVQGAGQACLVLDGMSYTLRITRAGKLILTK